MKPNIFVLLSTCMEVSVSLLFYFLHESLYQTVVVCYNPVLWRISSCMEHSTIFCIRVGSLRVTQTKERWIKQYKCMYFLLSSKLECDMNCRINWNPQSTLTHWYMEEYMQHLNNCFFFIQSSVLHNFCKALRAYITLHCDQVCELNMKLSTCKAIL